MSRWIVSAIPPWLLLLGLIAIISGGSVLLGMALRGRFPRITQDEHNDALKFGYGVIGFVYAFFIGFVVSAMWGQINDADSLARTEGAAGVQLARDASVFDPADGDRIRQSLLSYERAAEAEWPMVARGQSLPEADTTMATLYRTFQELTPRTDIQKAFLSTSLANLDTISQSRTERIIEGTTDVGPTWPLWAVIFLTSGLVMGCTIVYGVEKTAMHYPMVAIVGAMVAANLFLVLELSHPFVGDISTSSEPLHMVVEVLTQLPS
jgi:hypothetical protein